MTMYRTVIWKDAIKVYLPDNMTDDDKSTWITNMQNAKSDFEGNHKSDVTVINYIRRFDEEVDYDTFKNKIDGQTVTWSDVKMFETSQTYYLFVEA